MRQLHVRVEGQGPDLVLLHGWGFHSGAWNGAAEALASRYRVHRIDLPGHGHSGECRMPDFDAAVESVGRLVPRRSLIAGWSLGGLFAQRLAASGHAAGLVLVGATPCFVARDDWAEGMHPATLEAFARDLQNDPTRTLEQFARLNALGGAQPRETARAMVQRLHEAPLATPGGLGDALRWLRETDLRASSARLDVPCVILHGARDRITPVGAARWLAREIRGAHLVELDDAAHLPFATHAPRFVEAVERLDA